MDLGRARGRAAGRGRGALIETEAGLFAREPSAAIAETEPAQRGRGGFYRPGETFCTIPPGVTVTTGDNQGNLKIVTNYFKLVVPKEQVVYAYHVDFEPQVESVKVRRGLIYENRQVFDRAYVFDGGSEIKSLCKLDSDPCTIIGTRRDGGSVTITIKFTTSVSWGHPEMLRLYNTQMRRNLEYLGFIQVGRDYYTPDLKKIMREHKIEIWPGILTAIAEHDGGILMVNDMINKIIRQENALAVLNRIRSSDRNRTQELCNHELSGSIVMTQYNNKTYRVEEVVLDRTPVNYTFERRGETVNLRDYYNEQYDLRITDERQPLLLAQPTEKQMRGGEKKDILLIPEFCIMTGLTKDMAADFNFKRALGELTRLDPLGRAQALTQFIRRLNSNDRVKEEMRAWGLHFSESLVELNARSLPAEKIIVSGDSGESVPYQQRTGSFEREMRNKRMRTAARVEQWAILGLRQHKGLIDEFIETLKKICGPLGVSLGQPKLMPVENERAAGYMEICRKIPAGAKMVVILVPNTNAERYSAVKRYFCVEAPCPSQVITTRVLSNKKNLMSVATKILIQMSTKMGAEPWGIAIPPRSCMIVGYDTYHDSQRKGYSVGGFVCTSNGAATSWFSRTSYHQSREELCGNFANNFRAGLKNWSDKNNAWPERIVIYRDGVSEGQIPYVYNVEMKQLQDVLKEKEGLEKVAFVFIIVTKRVNARFFLRVGERELQNPPPGTAIDSIVTRKQRYDFYLISQSVRQGTVNPTMYNIIADNTNWRPIHHQQLAYKLCHMYYNWAGTITVPAPCQYAHKLAFLTGTALHREHDTRLSHTLFFL